MFDKGFMTGINYWASKNATQMWRDFDEESIDRDFEKLAKAGLTHLRVFPLWSDFQPLHALYCTAGVYEYRFGEESLPDTEAGRAGVSEEACRKFERFCQLADKHGLQMIVALITGQMSFRVFAPPAFEGKAYLTDPTVIKWQIRFVKYFVKRFREQSCIVGWDLGNEVNTMFPREGTSPDAFYVWCSTIADAIRAADGTRPVISGLDHSVVERGAGSLKELGEYCDMHTTHPYNIFCTSSEPLCSPASILDLPFKCRMGEDIGRMPTFVQEIGAIGYQTCTEKTEADYYRASLMATLMHGGHGLMWWCAFDQGHMGFAPYDWNNIGSNYGFFNREGQPKPLVKENVAFNAMLDQLPGRNLPAHRTDAVVLIPRDDGDASLDALRSAFLLGKQAGFDVRFTYALDPIPDAPLYILPSLVNSKSIPLRRLEALLAKVREGAVLYVSIGTTLFRRFPELFGVDVLERRVERCSRTMRLDGHALPITSEATLMMEPTTAEVVASDEQGLPMLTRNRYGKGEIWLLSAALERSLRGFGRADYPRYDLIYRALKEAAGIRRLCESDSPWVYLTEHAAENGTWICALNPTSRAQTVRLTLPPVWEPVYGPTPQGGQITLGPCEGAIWRV